MTLLRVHHIAIICSDYTISKEFYVNKLGLSVISEVFRKERNSYKLDLAVGGNYQIELFSFPHPPFRTSNPEARGLRHLAFEVENVEETAASFRSQNIPCEPVRVDEFTGKKYTFFQDPDGLPLEIYEI
jgi:glyoxylase I family protein